MNRDERNLFTIIGYIILIIITFVGFLISAKSVVASKEAEEFINETIIHEDVTPLEPSQPKKKPILLNNTNGLKKFTYINFSSVEEINNEIEKLYQYIEFLNSYTPDNIYFNDREVLNDEFNFINELINSYLNDLNKFTYTLIKVPLNYAEKDFKSYEDYRAIKNVVTRNYKLQNEYAYTGEEGIRMVNGRYCIAMGSYFTKAVGQYIDIILENGTVIPCILGDQKDDNHTDKLHIAHVSDGSIVEFIVDKECLNDVPKKMGNISFCHEEWNSPVAQVKIYNINIFEE